MKVCHVISSIDRSSGGTSEYLRLLTNELSSKCDNLIIAKRSNDPVDLNNAVEVKLASNVGKLFTKRKSSFVNLLNENCQLFHGNGLWQYPVNLMVKSALKRNIPYIISVHGMLEPWSLAQGKIKKKLALSLFQYNDLKRAACIHATSLQEVENIRKIGFKNPIAMIPNGVNLDEFPSVEIKKLNTPKKILFLSRIHIKKGIENLIEAWHDIDAEKRIEWKIEIVGHGEESYIESLRENIISKNLSSQIVIRKPVFGTEKIKLLREASVFVLPTFSENFGIVVAEALACYTPVITTKGTPWQDLVTHDCGWWIDLGMKPLKNALEKALSTNESKLIELGINGRKLVEKKYSMVFVAKQMIKLYKWILKEDNRPEFIQII